MARELIIKIYKPKNGKTFEEKDSKVSKMKDSW
jgi:hypothetical protein